MTENTTPTTKQTSPSPFSGIGPLHALHDEMNRRFRAFAAPQMSWSLGELSSSEAIGLRIDIGETDDFDKGVLTVTLPKPHEAKSTAKRIDVRSGA